MGYARNVATVSSPQTMVASAPLEIIRQALSGVERSLEPDQHITMEGAKRETVIGVVSGVLRCFRVTPDGRRHISRFVRAGGLIGLGALNTYRHSTEAVTASTIVELPVKALDACVDRDPRVRLAVVQAMTADINSRDRSQFRLGRLWADERVADFLLELADGGVAAASNVINMSRGDIADHLGVTIETVSRALHRFQRLGLVRLAGARRFTILRAGALRGFAAGDVDDFPQPASGRAFSDRREGTLCAAS